MVIFSGYVSFREGIFGGIEETLNDLCPERVSTASLSMGPDLGKYCSTSPFHGTNWEVTKPDLTKKLCTRIIVLCYYCLYSHPTHFTVYKGGIPYLRGLLRPGAEPAVARPSQTPGPGHYVAKVLITVEW